MCHLCEERSYDAVSRAEASMGGTAGNAGAAGKPTGHQAIKVKAGEKTK